MNEYKARIEFGIFQIGTVKTSYYIAPIGGGGTGYIPPLYDTLQEANKALLEMYGERDITDRPTVLGDLALCDCGL
jgi:hypothetical protein